MDKICKVIKTVFKYFIMYLSMLMPRSYNICVFGAWLGERFSDNSKQLFLEMQKHKNLRAVWITKDRETAVQIKKLGHEVYMWGTFKAVWLQLRAKYAVVSNGISDLEHTFLGRAVIINLWHGIPLKKVCYDNKYEKNWDSPVQKARDFIVNIPLGNMFYVATSKMFTEIYQSAFRVHKEQVLCLGQPRSDIFFQKEKPAPYFPGKNIILYCPTHRKEGAQKIDIAKLFDLKRLEIFLKENNYYFVVKKHFYHRNEKEELSMYPHIIDATGMELDIQKLIIETKAMVTDYSSIYIDYLLLGLPLLFYCYDYEEYLAKDREMYFNYEDVTPGFKAKNFDELLNELEIFANNGGGYAKEDRERVKNLFYCKEAQGFVSGSLVTLMENRAFGHKRLKKEA
ncbi:MAG: CDP-glycerol glycerophosphotransferase family protein [Lachnospiraceae bacterium]|nr:CDP-glycerol glycerophosphotransferase family protein [Lachnospiraceae bacterium]